MISPAWAQLKVGPFLRGESDLRLYLDIFKYNPSEIKGIRKIKILAFYRRLKEPSCIEKFKPDFSEPNALYAFEGLKDYFGQLNGWNSFLNNELNKIIRTKHITLLNRYSELPPIGIHVRLGDATPKASPISWHAETLKMIRKSIGVPIKAFVVSDGKAGELKELLSLNNVSLIKTGNAISDLMLLSRAKVLIATGSSSFSSWASFLTQIPTLTMKGYPLTWFKIKENENYRFCEFDPLAPPRFMLNKIIEVLSATDTI